MEYVDFELILDRSPTGDYRIEVIRSPVGEADSVVPMNRSKEMVEAIREEGGSVKFTTYPDVGHNSWDKAYGKDEGAVEWLLAQER